MYRIFMNIEVERYGKKILEKVLEHVIFLNKIINDSKILVIFLTCIFNIHIFLYEFERPQENA